MNHLDWGRVYVTSEWLVRIVALVYVPQRRAPNAARAWLLLIFFLPWPGAVLYFLLGRAWMPRRRYRVQKQISELIRGLVPRPESFEARTGHPVPVELLPALRLADSISEFPAVGGCRFELLPEYDQAIERVIAEIGRARRYVHLLFYIFEDDEVGRRVADSLIAAAQRGVAVRLLLDAIGSRTGLARLGPGLRTVGIEVIAAMPLRFWGPNAARFDLRNHRKIVIVDGEVAYFGSQNIVSARANRGLVNEELLVRATGTIVRHLHAVLLGDRYLETGALPPESDDLAPPELNLAVDGLAQVVPSGPGYNEGSSEAVMIALMYGACSRIVLTAPYVIPNAAFLGAMTSAARRGVSVALIVDAESNKPLVQLAQQSYYAEMLRAGIRIHHHHGSFLHAKHLSIDDGAAVIGSSNFDIRSFALNAEVSVLIFDRAVVTRLRTIQESYLAKSEEVTAESRRQVPRPRRAIENLARLTDTLL